MQQQQQQAELNPLDLDSGSNVNISSPQEPSNPQSTPKATSRERVPVMTNSVSNASNAMNVGIGIQGLRGPSPLRQESREGQ